jgi:hypothetical protein
LRSVSSAAAQVALVPTGVPAVDAAGLVVPVMELARIRILPPAPPPEAPRRSTVAVPFAPFALMVPLFEREIAMMKMMPPPSPPHASTMILLPTTGFVANAGDVIEVPEAVLNLPVDWTKEIAASAGPTAAAKRTRSTTRVRRASPASGRRFIFFAIDIFTLD